MKKTSNTVKKIVIVGAGPIGCYCGQLLKEYGFDPLILEEHAEVGKPVSCAGIVGKNVFDDMQMAVSKDSIINTIDGAKISYDTSAFLLKRPGVAYIIDREKFDKNLSKGLRIEYNTRFLEVHKEGPGYTLTTSNGEYYADVVIGADGPNSRVRKAFAFASNMKLYKGLQYRIKHEIADKDRVEVSYEKPFSLFTWLIPEGNGIIRIGTISDRPLQQIEDFIKRKDLADKEIVEKNSGPIPIGTCQMIKNNSVALVGDAACQIKPITSGGIYYGMKSAEILARAIKENDLSYYERTWNEEFGQEIKFCLLARFTMEDMSSDVLAKVFDFVKENSTIVEKVGDFENHSTVLWSLITSKRTYSTIGSVMMDVLKKPKTLVRLLRRK